MTALTLAWTPAAFAQAARAFQDPLDTAAPLQTGDERLLREPLLALSAGPSGMLAVGLRGLALHAGANGVWKQSQVPVQSDLVAVQALAGGQAWAVGHDAVILASGDAGATWRKVFDRRAAQQSLAAYYEQRIATGVTAMQPFLDQIKLNTEGQVSLPFLGVHFDDANKGYAVGSFGLIVATEDGGKTWQPWLHRIDNPKFLNLNAVRSIAGRVLVVGEQGRIYRLDPQRRHFTAVDTGYKGTFFDIVGSSRSLVAFGLRGTVYRSTDGGESWQLCPTGVERAITAGAVFDDGRTVLLFTETGQALESTDEGASFKPLALPRPVPVFAAAATAQGRLVTAGYVGMQTQDLK